MGRKCQLTTTKRSVATALRHPDASNGRSNGKKRTLHALRFRSQCPTPTTRPVKRRKAPLDVVHSFHALRDSSNQKEVLEWIGDAVVGECVGRCLLSQFHVAPLASRVFRQLRLAVVTNENLARVFDDMGYGNTTLKQKQKADLVEAVVGECLVRLTQFKSDTDGCKRVQAHLNALIAETMRLQFQACHEWHQTHANGPLLPSFNAFTCLPEEHLNEETGELIVSDGAPLPETNVLPSDVDPMDDYTTTTSGEVHHAFASTLPCDAPAWMKGLVAGMLSDPDHILKSSAEIFEVFKIYGMTVLSERVSLALVPPHLETLGRLTPALLTRERQRVLSMQNLASSAIQLGVAASDPEIDAFMNERRCANTVRALVGFCAAADGRHRLVVDRICAFLHARVDSTIKALAWTPLSTAHFSWAVAEARQFMTSATCDALHRPNERPPVQSLKSPLDGFVTLVPAPTSQSKPKKTKNTKKTNETKETKKTREPSAQLKRFEHRRFLFCLEELVVSFAQQQIAQCRSQLSEFAVDLEPCALPDRPWQVDACVLTMSLRDGFYRLLLHDVCAFHGVVSSSRNTRDGIRITQIRRPLHYKWHACRIITSANDNL